MAKKIVSLSEFIPDKNNANLGSERGQQMIKDSLQEDGTGRSIVVDAHNNVVAGNKTLNSALKAGIDKAIVVETNGEELVVVRRKDWDLYSDEAPRRYAYRDNRSSEVSLNWNPEQILADVDKGMDLSNLFSKDEIEILQGIKIDNPYSEWGGMPEFEQENNFGAITSIKVHFATEEAVQEFAKLVEQTVNVKTQFIWFPKQERAKLKELGYISES